MDAGADDFLRKPFKQHELEVRLRAGQRIVKLQEELIAARESLRVRSAVGDQPIATIAGPIKVTISIGATMATKGAKVEDVLARADSAMYQAKSQGRNRVCCAEPDHVQEADTAGAREIQYGQ